MRKTILPFLILILVFHGFGQETDKTDPKSAATPTKSYLQIKKQKRKFKNKSQYIVKYDKFEDITLVRYTGFQMLGAFESVAIGMTQSRGRTTLPSLLFGSGFFFETENLSDPIIDDFAMFFTWNGSRWLFLYNSKLIALADGERIRFGEGVRSSRINLGGLKETVYFKASREQLTKLANAKKLEIKVGSVVRKLKRKHQMMLKNMLALSDPKIMPPKKKR